MIVSPQAQLGVVATFQTGQEVLPKHGYVVSMTPGELTMASNVDRLPPNNQEAERAVLCGMLRNNKCIDDAMLALCSDSFYTDAHQRIFGGILDLHVKRHPVDLVSLANWLTQKRFVEDVGGYRYLADLWEANPSAGNVPYYCSMVRDVAIARNLIHVTMEIQREAYEPYRPAAEMLASAESMVMSVGTSQMIGETVTFGTALRETINDLDERSSQQHEAEKMMLTGFMDFDEKTAGLHNGELVIVAARPSVGKTALALNLISKLTIERKMPCFFASLEQSRKEVCERFLSMHAGVNLHSIRRGRFTDQEVDSLQQATERITDAPLSINDDSDQSMMKIAANARRHKSRDRIRLVVVDYLQLVEPENRRDNRNEQVGQSARRLKFLARELQVPVIVLAQLNREGAEGKPKLHQLRDSGEIEAHADTVLLLHKPEDSQGILEVDVAKQRNGPVGSFTLTFQKQFMRFENYAPEI